MSEIDKNNEKDNSEIDTSSIFDDFEVDSSIKEELSEENQKKNFIYFINKISSAFVYVNIFLIIIILIFGAYIYIQRSESDLFEDKSFLNPFCYIISGTDNLDGNCSGIKILSKKIDTKIKQKEDKYFKSEKEIIKKAYQVDSVENSIQAIFIKDKVLNKNNPSMILDKFDKIKDKFTGIEKDKIICDDIMIEDDYLEAKCTSFSDALDSNIPGFNGEKSINTISGTSITLASSFINFIDKSEYFDVIDKQKVFDKKPYFGEGKYIYKTDFKIKAKYNKKQNNLSL